MSDKRKSQPIQSVFITVAAACAMTMSIAITADTPEPVDSLGVDSPIGLSRAEYVAEYQGLPIKAKGVRELTRIGENEYEIRSSAQSMLIQIAETSRFEYHSGRVTPVEYQYERSGVGKNKLETDRFDWQLMQHASDDGVTPLLAETLDKLSYQLQLRIDVARALRQGDITGHMFAYRVADQAKRKDYQFRVVGEDTLDTPMGALRTLMLERVRDHEGGAQNHDRIRTTRLWLAVDHDLMLAQLTQEENGKGFALRLDRFEHIGEGKQLLNLFKANVPTSANETSSPNIGNATDKLATTRSDQVLGNVTPVCP